MSKQGLYEKQECNVVGILNMEGNSPIMEINGESVNLLDILRFVIPILCIIIALIVWLKYGKDDHSNSLIRYHAPDGINSFQASYLLSDSITDKSIVSLLLMFCYKGYIRIIENKHDFEIEKLKDYDGNDLCEKIFFQRFVFIW